MSKSKSKTQNEINEGIRDYQQNKIMKRSSLTKEQFEAQIGMTLEKLHSFN